MRWRVLDKFLTFLIKLPERLSFWKTASRIQVQISRNELELQIQIVVCSIGGGVHENTELGLQEWYRERGSRPLAPAPWSMPLLRTFARPGWHCLSRSTKSVYLAHAQARGFIVCLGGYKRHNIEIGNVSVDPNDPKFLDALCDLQTCT